MKYSIPYGTGAQTLETNDPALVLESKIQSLEACADEDKAVLAAMAAKY